MAIRRSYTVAKKLADQILKRLEPFCYQIEVSGQIRRKLEFVTRLDFILVPKPAGFSFSGDMFNQPYLIDLYLDDTTSITRLMKGPKRQRFQFSVNSGVCDVWLHIQPDPRTWAMNMLLSTGPNLFGQWIVTPKSKGGAVPMMDGAPLLYCKDSLWYFFDDTYVPVENEANIFNMLQVPYVPPELRTDKIWQEAKS